MRARIVSNSKPFHSLRGVMREVAERVVKAGHFSEAGRHYSGYSYAELMQMHEDGLGNLPSRPVYLISSMVIKGDIGKSVGRDIKDFVGKGDTSSLSKVGEYMEDTIKMIFGDLSLLEEKAESTKRSSVSPDTPLIELGDLRRAVAYKVE